MIFVISGPSAVGKTTLIQRILRDKKYQTKFQQVVTCTTRKRRKGEIDGIDYYFISQEEFESWDKDSYCCLTQTFEHKYCIKKSIIQDILDQNKMPLFIINYDGYQELKTLYENVVGIFITVKNLNILMQRLKKRKSESPELMKIRFDNAKNEIANAVHYDNVLINNHFPTAIKRMQAIFNLYIN